MREFSLLHSRFRQLPVVLAIIAVGALVVMVDRNGAEPDGTTTATECPTAGTGPAETDCSPVPAPPPSAPSDGVDRAGAGGKAGPGGATDTTGDPERDDAWSEADVDGEDVPFISLQPAPNTATEAGRELMAEAEARRTAAAATTDSTTPGPSAPTPAPATSTTTPDVLEVGLAP
ncbi:MAG: hypothetical protein AAFN30_12495 [Actinomycetota bacterium]